MKGDHLAIARAGDRLGMRKRVGDRQTTRAVTRCGCFLPDLTGLARRPSTADLPDDA
jgi:hypothetical protein